MFPYRNVMELIVEEHLDRIFDTLDCCHCPRCRSDVIAFALNQLPARYVVTQMGEALTKTHFLHYQNLTDVMSAIAQGANMVRGQPRHESEPEV